jgi:hypothetical protein
MSAEGLRGHQPPVGMLHKTASLRGAHRGHNRNSITATNDVNWYFTQGSPIAQRKLTPSLSPYKIPDNLALRLGLRRLTWVRRRGVTAETVRCGRGLLRSGLRTGPLSARCAPRQTSEEGREPSSEPIAEARFSGVPLSRLARAAGRTDFAMAREAAARLGGDSDLDWLMARAHTIVRQDWPRIERIAAALVQRRELDYADVLQLL